MFMFKTRNAAIDAFAAEHCASLAKRFPPGREAELSGERARSGAALGNALADLQQRMVKFQIDNKLGVYGKARLLRSIQQELRRLEYSDRFIDATTDLLVPATAARPR